jgi:thiol-disulfide isomerase/thioredoxin
MLRIKLIILVLSITSFLWGQDKFDFTLNLTTGDSKQFSEYYSDGPVLVNFWALWCKPCRAEMKSLNEIHKKYIGKGFKIIGINQDSPRSEAKVKSYISGYGIDYDIATDPNKIIFEKFNGQVIPLSILFNNKGEIVYQHTGYFSGDEFEIEEAVKKVLELK